MYFFKTDMIYTISITQITFIKIEIEFFNIKTLIFKFANQSIIKL